MPLIFFMIVFLQICSKLSEIEPNLNRIRETLLLSEEDVLIPFSAEKGTNCDLLKANIQKAIEEN